MKKYLIALIALLVVVTGCGNTKKLNCTIEEDGTNGVMNMEFDKNDDLTKLTMTMSEEFEEELTKEELEMYKSFSSLACAEFPTENVECEVNVTTKKMELTVTYNIAKMSAEDLYDVLCRELNFK